VTPTPVPSTNLFDSLTSDLNGLLATNLSKLVHNLPNAILTAIVGFIIIRLVSFVASWLIGFVRMPKGLKEIVVSLIDAILMVILVIIVLQTLGLNNAAFVFTAAVAGLGIAVGNGSVTLVTDVVSGIYLARDRNFSVGDIVVAGEDKVEGEIISMDMRRTRIRDKDGYIHSLPNTGIDRNQYILISKRRDRTDIK
jgi:small-conductance mechanosensitive channel